MTRTDTTPRHAPCNRGFVGAADDGAARVLARPSPLRAEGTSAGSQDVEQWVNADGLAPGAGASKGLTMPRFQFLRVNTQTGEEETVTIEAADANDAAQRAQRPGFVVGSAPAEAAVPATSHPDGEPGWVRGQALANTAGWLVFLGLGFAPFAWLGWVLGAAAMELSRGRRGDMAERFGAILTVLWTIVFVIGVIYTIAEVRAIEEANPPDHSTLESLFESRR